MTAIEREINNIYKIIFKQVFGKQATTALMKGNRSTIYQNIARIESSAKYDEFAKKFSLALTKKGLNKTKGVWRKYFEAAKKAHAIALPKTFSEFEIQMMQKAIAHNFTMIKSIPSKMMEIANHKYTTILIEEVAKNNLPRGTFRKELESHGYKQAKVIARTEAAKLQTSIMRNRATDLGSIAYFWLSSRDKRTRPSHREMNGVVVFWRNSDLEKPHLDNMYGDAGEFPNCRCAPEPILDEDDLTKNSYQVYDYRTHNVITLSKADLITALENKQL